MSKQNAQPAANVKRKAQSHAWLVAFLIPIFALLGLLVVTLLQGGPLWASDTPMPFSQPEDDIPEELRAMLPKTADAGQAYIDDTLFAGDSNTLRMYHYGLLELDNVAAQTSIGIESVTSLAFLYFEGDARAYTLPEAVAILQPRRVVMTFGTNNIGDALSMNEFIAEYRTAIAAIREAYPHCDIIVASIPPVREQNAYTQFSRATIQHYNAALQEMCRQDGLAYLNTYEALAGEDGHARAGYTVEDGLHLSDDALRAVLRYTRTHALQTEDRRPAVSAGIPGRVPGPAA